MTKNLMALSLKAFWNCVTIRLQKPNRHPPGVAFDCFGVEVVTWCVQWSSGNLTFFWWLNKLARLEVVWRSIMRATFSPMLRESRMVSGVISRRQPRRHIDESE